MAVAAGATEIEWYYSYPKAFSEAQVNKLKGIWNSVIANCKSISQNISPRKAIAKTESVSMAEFFKNKMNATFERGMVCFDIGGGSTDIAIWQGSNNDKPVGQCSLMFAGQDIFNRQLFKNRNILLDLKSADDGLNAFIQGLFEIPADKQDQFNMELEALLKYKQEILLDGLRSNSEHRNVKLFLRNIAFALSGIFYYAGGIVGQCFDLSNKKQLPHCFVGGNASRLLDWVDQGNYAANHTFENIYTKCLVAGAVTKEKIESSQARFNVKQSSNPKEEVAYGLLWDTPSSSNNQNSNSGDVFFDPFADDSINILDKENALCLLAGERIWVNGEENDGNIINTEDVKAGITVDPDLPNFRRFLKGFNALIAPKGFTGEYAIEFGEAEFDELRDQTNEFFVQQSRLEVNEINLEPPFIIVLKQALELLSR